MNVGAVIKGVGMGLGVGAVGTGLGELYQLDKHAPHHGTARGIALDGSAAGAAASLVGAIGFGVYAETHGGSKRVAAATSAALFGTGYVAASLLGDQ